MTATTATATPSLWTRYQATRDLEARRQLLEQCLGLVHHIARQTATRVGGAVEVDDLVSAGTLGLVLALESFDPERGLAFSTYATPRIRGAILDELRSCDWVPRSVRSRGRKVAAAVQELEGKLGRAPSPEEVAAFLEIGLQQYWRWREDVDGAVLVSFDTRAAQKGSNHTSYEETLSDPSLAEPTEALSKEEEVADIRKAIGRLPQKERTVLSLYYYEELTLLQIAEILHLTESRISQIRSQAFKRLRAEVQLRGKPPRRSVGCSQV